MVDDPGPAGPRPFGAPSAGRCQSIIGPSETSPLTSSARLRQCDGTAQWALPEFPVCFAHRATLPDALEQVRRERVRRWHEESSALWARILEEVPA